MPQATVNVLTPAARRVLDVAGELFYARGINTVGMELVAATAGVTKKTIYDRFGSKQALVVAYLHDRDQRWRLWLRRRLDAVDDPQERVLATFDALDEWIGDNYRGCAMINAYVELSDPDHPGREVARDQKVWLYRLYTELLTQAGVLQPKSLAELMLILHEGATVSAHMADRGEAVAIARRAAAALLSTG